ncbi:MULTISPECIES: YbjN domain-containing protein [Pseudomonas]|uniref:YbjN domain-containing protein n=1 Tax=Pseudomonas TaxID=286 RepID=UPI001E2DAB83|nr:MULTISPECIES: YbjN domain-containing protein [Pseudomonas]MCE1117212.1 YbjN domain-containing protein [Pseudomonas sp. NMI795_08]
MTEQALIESVNVETLTSLLQDAGLRVNRSEQNGLVQLLSASQGIGFAVRLGNPAPSEGQYLDFTFSCALRIQGELPEGVVEHWSTSRRFARLYRQGEFLVMELDVLVSDGVSARHLLNHLQLWDRLLQEFITYLRDFSRHAAQTVEAETERAS